MHAPRDSSATAVMEDVQFYIEVVCVGKSWDKLSTPLLDFIGSL